MRHRNRVGWSAAVCLAATAVPLSWGLTARASQTFVVNSAADSDGACTATLCTLREAIEAANAAGGGQIQFNIAPGGAQTIAVGASGGIGLPEVTASNVSIDATTQPGAAAPSIRVDDPSSSSTMSGLTLGGQNDTVRGLVITRFHQWGLVIATGSSGDVVAGNWIGTADGTTAAGTGAGGIDVQGPGGNTIGGTTAADRNLVSGSAANGITVEQSNINVLTGNWVGVSADGRSRLPNAGVGIDVVNGSSGNRLGGTTAGERNLVTGNGAQAIRIIGQVNSDGSCSAPSGNVVEGNWIGLTAQGTWTDPSGAVVGNVNEGVLVQVCATHNLIGGATPGSGNVIAANNDDGIQIDGLNGPPGGVCNTTVQGNYIGTDPTGTINYPNNDAGVKVQNGACNTLVGGATAAAGNLISGNNSDGVYIDRPNTSGTVVEGNVIGLKSDGVTPLPNQGNGVHVFQGVPGAQVLNNTISGNMHHGVLIADSGTTGVVVSGNRIGTDTTGSSPAGNRGDGVLIYDGTQGSTVQGNTIRGNAGPGVAVKYISQPTLDNRITANSMQGNSIGIDLMPVPGVNVNDGNNSNPTVGNDGINYPVLTGVSSTGAAGTAPPGATVELFSAVPDAGVANGEGATYLGSTTADSSGAWCRSGLSISGPVTATATDSAGNTSEFSANVSPGTGTVPCSTVLFSDSFSGADGSAPDGNFQVRRSASGTGAGATIQGNALQLTPLLSSSQSGTWQWVQAREQAVQPSWSSNSVTFRWQMSTAASADQTENFVLAPTAAAGYVLNEPDYLRLRVQNNGTLAIVRRVAGGSATTLWWAKIPATTALQDFVLTIDSTNISLSEGAPGAAALLVGPMAHGLSWTSAYPYFSASTDLLPAWNALFDTFEIDSQ